MIQQNDNSTQNLLRQIWDRSAGPTKEMGKATDKEQQLQEPLNIHT